MIVRIRILSNRIKGAFETSSEGTSIFMDTESEDVDAFERISKIYEEKCCSGKGNDVPCTERLSIESAKNLNSTICGLTKSVRDAFICGLLTACRKDAGTRSAANRGLYREDPKRSFNEFSLFGGRVCKRFFYCVCGLSDNVVLRLNSISRSILTSENVDFNEQRGGNHSVKNISKSDVDRIIQFLDNYASIYGLPATPRQENNRSTLRSETRTTIFMHL